MRLVAILCLSGQRLGERSPQIFCKWTSDLPKCCRSRFDRRCFHACSTSPPPPPHLRDHPRRATAITCLLVVSIYLPREVHSVAAAGPSPVCGRGRSRPHRRWKRHPATQERARPREQIPTRTVAERRRLSAPGDEASFVFSSVRSKKMGQSPSTRTPSPSSAPLRACLRFSVCPPRTFGGQTGTTNSSTLAVAGGRELRTDVHGEEQKERQISRRNNKRTVSPTAAKHTRTRTHTPFRSTFLFPFNRCPAPDLPTHSLPSSASPASSSQAD
ncbi:hypothetical protein ECC02_000852 [Trypanosoma cruzi]|uniref:Uncharacterized protein n=1 Tax=Trypanosoma cruzi TaxID=5693 RepID=A0A7J6YHF9_TRYCR|nr:hypothetical protein ECC02_000852 [Trypanosoma cruzi]